jgi:hypothetical protein
MKKTFKENKIKKNSKKTKTTKNSKKIKKQSAGNYKGHNPDIEKSEIEHAKCAPDKEYTDGSCFTLDTLKEMAHKFNAYIDMKLIKNKNKINLNEEITKKDLVKGLTEALKDVCDDQLCWLKQDFVNNLDDKVKKDIDYTFRPEGPKGRFSWLSTSNINEVIDQYHNVYPNFEFLGAVPIDFDDLNQLGIKNLDFNKLYDSGKHKIGIIFNTDEHYKSGEHWIALYADLKKFQIYYFDSYGIPPEKRVRKFVKRIALWCNKTHNNFDDSPDNSFMKPNKRNNIEQLENADIRYNTTKHQQKNSECGVYSINFILRLLKGKTFDHLTRKRLTDNQVNKCRLKYFGKANKKDFEK